MILFMTTMLCIPAQEVIAQQYKIKNRPYIDQRRFHYGFSVGINMQDYELRNSNTQTSNGELWYADVPDYAPGFSVGVLGELYLNNHLSLRLLPTLHFGSRDIYYRNYNAGNGGNPTEERHIQQTRSTHIALPLNLKFSAPRTNNYRPYLVTGLSPMYDLNIKKGDRLRFAPLDCHLELGFGCDYYFPFFKFIPELKFSYGLFNLIHSDRSDLQDQSLSKFRDAGTSAHSKMITLTLYFE